jgi:phosphate:Na+ symporter
MSKKPGGMHVLSNFIGLVRRFGAFSFWHADDGFRNAESGGGQAAPHPGILTSNPYIATVTGIIVTVLVQSSSTTTIMVVGFANAGLMTLNQAVGTILGANIGTTITAQMVSFKVGVIIYARHRHRGLFLIFSAPTAFIKHIGQGILGFGLFFWA